MYNSNENIIKQFGKFSSNQDDRGGSTVIPSAVVGIVKNNVDPAHSGKLDVYLVRQDSSANHDNASSWVSVNYMSPFFGYTTTTSNKSDDGKFVGNPNSYGMWMTPPDIGTEVLCVFLNGDPSQGYYIGCLPNPGVSHMVPAIGSSSSLILNEGEATSYGGAKSLPVSEINNANPAHSENPNLTSQPRTVHSYQAAILNKQGLIRDPDRGTITSSSSRESPSRVFGISTPGRPIYQGGYTDDTIKDAISDPNTPNDKFKIIGRTGGHTFVMDDGDLTGKDQLVRLRTSAGHMIMMNDKAQTLFIVHANGKSYIELGKEGTIDMYSTNSVNIRTQGDLNLHADNNVNIKANKDINISADNNLHIESLKETTTFVGTTFKGYTKGDYTQKNESKTSISSAGEYGVKSKGTVYVVGGPDVKLNSGDPSLTPAEVKQQTVIQHTDTLYDSNVGWAAAPGKLSSIVSRAPAHSPWASANAGVDVQVNLSADSNFPKAPSSAVQNVNSSAGSNLNNSTSPSIAATTPSIQGTSSMLGSNATRSMASQLAVTAQTGPLGALSKQGAGIYDDGTTKTSVIGNYGLNADHLDKAGIIKPGSASAVQLALDSGKSLTEAMPNNIFTGQNGIKSLPQFLNDSGAQAQTVNTLFQQGEQTLKSSGLITGLESATQTGGLVMGTAIAGLPATMKSMGDNALGLKIPNVSTSSLGLKLPGSIGDLVSGGNFATNLADKTMTSLSGVSLGGIDVSAKLKDLSAGLFSSVTSGFKALAANLPQDLTKINEEASAELTKAASSLPALASGLSAAASSFGLSVPSLPSLPSLPSASGLDNLPGGLSAVSNMVTKGAAEALPGIGSISTVANNITGNLGIGSGNITGLVNDLKGKLAAGTKSLESLATSGLGSGDISKLTGAMSAIGAGGAVDVKLPVTATDTFNTDELEAQAKKLLGDLKIPPIKF